MDRDVAADRRLVECYANEMACAGGLSEAVLYGWALDSFLADPTEFRARVRLVRPARRAYYMNNTSDDDDPAVATAKTLFSLARRGFTSKYRGVSWKTDSSKWQAHGRKMSGGNEVSGMNYFIGYFESEDDAARAYDTHVQEHKLNMPLNANADGVLVARERGSVYQGVAVRELTGGKRKFEAQSYGKIRGETKRAYVYLGKFDDETQAAIAHDAFVRTMPPSPRSRLVNFLSFDEQVELKLPRPFLVEIVRKTNRNVLRWEKATITKCRTDNSAHAEEHSACLLYFLDFENDLARSCWDSLIPADPKSLFFAHRQIKVIIAPKKAAASRAGAKNAKVPAPTDGPSAPRENNWWKRFMV